MQTSGWELDVCCCLLPHYFGTQTFIHLLSCSVVSPSIDLAPSNLSGIRSGERALFACETRSYPVSQVEWFLVGINKCLASVAIYSHFFAEWQSIGSVI